MADGPIPLTMDDVRAVAEFIYRASQWSQAGHDRLMAVRARLKTVWGL